MRFHLFLLSISVFFAFQANAVKKQAGQHCPSLGKVVSPEDAAFNRTALDLTLGVMGSKRMWYSCEPGQRSSAPQALVEHVGKTTRIMKMGATLSEFLSTVNGPKNLWNELQTLLIEAEKSNLNYETVQNETDLLMRGYITQAIRGGSFSIDKAKVLKLVKQLKIPPIKQLSGIRNFHEENTALAEDLRKLLKLFPDFTPDQVLVLANTVVAARNTRNPGITMDELTSSLDYFLDQTLVQPHPPSQLSKLVLEAWDGNGNYPVDLWWFLQPNQDRLSQFKNEEWTFLKNNEQDRFDKLNASIVQAGGMKIWAPIYFKTILNEEK